MRAKHLVASFAIVISALVMAAVRAADESGAPPADNPSATPNQPSAVPSTPPAPPAPPAAPKEPAQAASVTIIGAGDAHGVLGRDVRSAANEDMGHVVDVIVDREGLVRAAVIDFGGFLGVGSRKIVVGWKALRFG